jgi:hypothetical protein
VADDKRGPLVSGSGVGCAGGGSAMRELGRSWAESTRGLRRRLAAREGAGSLPIKLSPINLFNSNLNPLKQIQIKPNENPTSQTSIL